MQMISYVGVGVLGCVTFSFVVVVMEEDWGNCSGLRKMVYVLAPSPFVLVGNHAYDPASLLYLPSRKVRLLMR